MPTNKTLEHYLHQLRLIEEHREKDCEAKVRKYYKELMKDLNNFLGNEYAELAQDDKLTFEILHSKGKYARFIEEVEQRTDFFTRKVAKTIKETVQTTYQKAFDGMVKAVEQSQDYYSLKLNLKGLKATTPEIIKNAVKNTFLEDALEKNHKTVIYDIKQQIGVGLSQGDRMSTMARRISEQLDKDYKKATQITRTECHRVREAGWQDSSQCINDILKDSGSDYVMVKVWKTKQDERVRPQQRRKTKKGWKTTYSKNGADHMKMHDVMVLVDEMYELPSGAKAISPGQSGVASEDINCRCGSSRDFITKAEYAKLKGKKVDNTPTEDIEKTVKSDTIEAKSEIRKGFEVSTTNFIPAKNTLEAEQYAKRKVKYVDYSNLPLKTANEMNKALDTLPDGIAPVFMGTSNTLEKYFGGTLPRKSKDYYGVTAEVFTGIHLGYGKGVDFDTTGSMVGISSSYKTADKITAAKKKAQELYKEKHDGHTWFFNVSGETTPYHEMGHVYANAKGLPSGFDKDAIKWATETQCDMLLKPSEAWAEAWAAYHTKSNKLPSYIEQYIISAIRK